MMKLYGAFAVLSLMLSQASHAKLVYEEELEGNSNPQVQVNVSNNEDTKAREALDTLEKSKERDGNPSENIRRQRLRQELKNEDILTQKLEEMRLRDEMKRSEELNAAKEKAETPKEPSVIPTQPVLIQNSNGVQTLSPQYGVQPLEQRQEEIQQEDTVPKKKRGMISVMPKAGLSNIVGSVYDVQSRMAVGLTVGVEIGKQYGLDLSYTYARYGLSAGSSLSPYSGSMILQKLQFNDNLIDLVGKYYFFDNTSAFRPSLGLGLGYRRGYLNYDADTIAFMRQFGYNTRDIEVSGFLGVIHGSVEYFVTDHIAIHAILRYYHILSAYQSDPVSPYAFVQPGAYSGYSMSYSPDVRSRAGNALANDGFYQALLGVSYSF